METLKSDRSILDHVLTANDPPSVILVHPKVDVTLDDEGHLPLPPTSETSSDSLAFHVQQGTFVLRVPWRNLPIVEIDGLDIQGTVSQEVDGRWLTIDAVDILQHVKLSDRHTQQNLILVAPLLSQATSLNGTISAQLNPVRICLDDEIMADRTLVRGTVQIHGLEAQLRKSWSRDIVRLVGQLTQSQIPEHVKLVSESAVDFRVTAEGIHHSGFSLLLPDVGAGLKVASSGVLRLNEQLDLAVDIQVPVLRKSGSAFLNSLAGIVRAPVELRVTGTISEPIIATSDGQTLLEDLTHRLPPAGPDENPDSIAGSIRGVVQAAATRGDAERIQRLPGRIFGLIQAIDAAKKTRSQSVAEDHPTD